MPTELAKTFRIDVTFVNCLEICKRKPLIKSTRNRGISKKKVIFSCAAAPGQEAEAGRGGGGGGGNPLQLLHAAAVYQGALCHLLGHGGRHTAAPLVDAARRRLARERAALREENERLRARIAEAEAGTAAKAGNAASAGNAAAAEKEAPPPHVAAAAAGEAAEGQDAPLPSHDAVTAPVQAPALSGGGGSSPAGSAWGSAWGSDEGTGAPASGSGAGGSGANSAGVGSPGGPGGPGGGEGSLQAASSSYGRRLSAGLATSVGRRREATDAAARGVR